ncbi:MAG: type II toxin-antitoxin system prevent-host-death family antitoxin [Rhizobiales bacterium]|nr:type II toxin-antitoxin system prevent-host-death family antitoxin [Hyphomicrobiales bacterium]
MVEYSTSDLSRKSGDIIVDALRGPVTITQRGKPRLVLLDIEEYHRLRRNADTRKSHTISTMPGELLEEAEKSLREYEASE